MKIINQKFNKCLSTIVVVGVMLAAPFTYANEFVARDYVMSSDGTEISYLDNQNEDKPTLLMVHGFSQSAEVWLKQFNSSLSKDYRLIAMDLRGHGYSAKPEDPKAYVSSKLWADDIHAILEQEKIDQFSLMAWSYGGLPALDYVKKYGQKRLNKLVMVATGYMLDLRPEEAGGPKLALGAGVIENTATMANIPAGPPGADLDGCDKAKNCDSYQRQYEGTKRFLEMVPAKTMDTATFANLLAQNMQTPSFVRRAMVIDRFVMSGPLDHTATLKMLEKPVLIIHGDQDQHVLPFSTIDMQNIIQSDGTKADRKSYDNIGHAPFIEDAARFNQDLANFLK